MENMRQVTKPKAKERIVKLRQKIAELQEEYHVYDNPSVSDEVYDSLLRELRDLEKKHPELISSIQSPTERIGGKPLDSFKKVKHQTRMTSLNDVFSYDEVKDWQNRISKLAGNDLSYFCELKLDGLSASLIYEKGNLVRGATRGDGLIGEDVSQNVRMIYDIPLKLKGLVPDFLEIRGEVVMSKKALEDLNKKQEKLGKNTFANTRNAAAGSLRQLDPNIVKERNLNFFAWDLILREEDEKKLNIYNHSEKHNYLKKIGFKTSPREKKVKNIDEVFVFLEEVEKIRQKLPIGTDGLVISVDDLKTRDNLGIVGKAPRHSVAYKYQAERATTTLKDIKVNVGRTGVLTPVAYFNETLVAGSIVSKATLHNMDQIKRLGLKIGDTIVIQKAGDVIPEVIEVIKDMRNGKERDFKMPDFCPVCGSKIEQKISSNKDKSVAYFCLNKKCEARNTRNLYHFVDVFEIYEIGPKIIDRLKDEGLISDASDLFILEKSDLAGLERFGQKSALNIINSINEHKKIPLWRFIYALGILQVGEQTARDLANYFNTIDKIKKATIEEIGSVPNIGPVVSLNIFNYFKDEHNLEFIDKLFKNGVSIEKEKNISQKLAGKVFVLTGTLPNLGREEAKKMIIERGGKVSSSVSTKTDYLLAGKEPGQKYKEAQKLKIKIIDE
ncbi:MAG TPA: NAD-dependent DNA ligase LigA, partial [Candidatus Paceibacterota bacterium]|nr:NAD-dependent DNA ligase LigA [Candidatus Paceibacterota bacterium]